MIRIAIILGLLCVYTTFKNPCIILLPDTDKVVLLASLINSECAGCSEREQKYVGLVVLNRMNNPKFPATIRGVIYQEGQFDGVGTPLFTPDTNLLGATADLFQYYKNASKKEKSILYFYSRKATDKRFVKSLRNRVVFKCKYHLYCR